MWTQGRRGNEAVVRNWDHIKLRVEIFGIFPTCNRRHRSLFIEKSKRENIRARFDSYDEEEDS